jgi:pyruvate/2-oxoglutarate dehydrogenase complex dihydrolipoamide dehydrogenase (E3) component
MSRIVRASAPAGHIDTGFLIPGLNPRSGRLTEVNSMKYHKPRRFDADVIVIGGGSAGLVCAYICAALKARVILIEAGDMGGDCLNTGCVPSKALISAARRAHHARSSANFGVFAQTRIDFSTVMQHVRGAIETIAPNDSVERYTALGVTCVKDHARLVDPWTVRAGTREFSARRIVLASGAQPAIPPIPGLTDVDYLTSDNLWRLDTLPQRLAVLGGGPIGCELSQAFARLGSSVSLFEMQPTLLAGEDSAVGHELEAALRDDGVCLHTGARVTSVASGRLRFATNGNEHDKDFDQILVATGRRPLTAGFGLEELGIEVGRGGIEVNPFLQTNYPHIYACGDVVGPYQFTHAAAHQAWHCAVNALFTPIKRFRVDYQFLPWTIYTDPEIARVGLNEAMAGKQGLAFDTTVFPFSELDRAVTEAETRGFIKILTRRRSDRILGATIVGSHAGELISTMTLAMKNGIGLNKLLSTIVPYPAWSEAPKRASGVWKAAHAPKWVFPVLQRFHQWRRG